MKKPLRVLQGLIVITFILGVAWEIQQRHSEMRLEALIKKSATIAASHRLLNRDEENRSMIRHAQLHQLWAERAKRNIKSDILSLLDDPDPAIRKKAVQWLGRLEDSSVERVLRDLMQQENGIPAITFKIAIARIHSKTFKGKEKLAAFTKSLGMRLEDLVRLSVKSKRSKGLCAI